MPAYLRMRDILMDAAVAISFAALGIEHFPKQTPPFVEETAIRAFPGQQRIGEIGRALGIGTVLGVVVGVVARTGLGDVDPLIARQDGPRTVPHAILQKVVVDIRVQLCALAVGGDGRAHGGSGAIIHHGHTGTHGHAHGTHADHIDVVHGARRCSRLPEAAGRSCSRDVGGSMEPVGRGEQMQPDGAEGVGGMQRRATLKLSARQVRGWKLLIQMSPDGSSVGEPGAEVRRVEAPPRVQSVSSVASSCPSPGLVVQ